MVVGRGEGEPVERELVVVFKADDCIIARARFADECVRAVGALQGVVARAARDVRLVV